MSRVGPDPWQALIIDDPVDAVDATTVDPFAILDQETAELPGDVMGSDQLAEGDVVLVVGVAGGLGTTTLAAGLALAAARDGVAVSLLDLDFECGATHACWNVPRQRTTGDLVPVLAELRPEHLDVIAHRHESGVDLLMSPATPGAATPWQAAQVVDLVRCAALRGMLVVDAGRAYGVHVDAVAELAGRVIVVTPATVSGMTGVTAARERMWGRPMSIALSPLRPAEMSARSFARGCGASIVTSIPRSTREAGELAAGRWPARGRRRLMNTVAALAGTSG